MKSWKLKKVSHALKESLQKPLIITTEDKMCRLRCNERNTTHPFCDIPAKVAGIGSNYRETSDKSKLTDDLQKSVSSTWTTVKALGVKESTADYMVSERWGTSVLPAIFSRLLCSWNHTVCIHRGTLHLSRPIDGQMINNTHHCFCVHGAQNITKNVHFPVL